MKIVYSTVITKFGLLGVILAVVPFPWSLIACLFATWVYQYIVALIYGVKVMPTMDTMCFLGDNDIRVNFMSVTVVDRVPFEQ